MPALQSEQTTASKQTTTDNQPMARSVAQAILEQLGLWGVKRIYGVVGDAVFGLIDALAKQTSISFIAVKHESVAAMMASAEAKVTGRLAVCISHMGPGLTNLITGLGDAYLDKVPVLAITGQVPLNKIGTTYKQYIDQQQLVQAVSSFSQMAVHPNAILESMTHAMYTSLLQRTVSHLSIPSDVFTMFTTMQPCEPPPVSVPSPDPLEIRHALDLLRSAKRPVLLVGSRARSAREPIRRLAEVWRCGIANSYGAVGIVPDSHPLMVSGLGEGGNPYLPELLERADVVLAVEASWPDKFITTSPALIQLVSHPSEFGTLRSASRRILGHTNSILASWIDSLSEYEPDPGWERQIRECKQAWAALNEKERNQNASPLSPSAIIQVMENHIPADAVIALDEGDSTLWFLRNFRAAQQNVLLSEHWRTMGFGLPAAMAAKCCLPEKQVVCITGDGGLAMVLADLITASRYGFLITLIVLNNGTLQMERDKMLMKGLQPQGTEIANPDFVKVSEACGWISYHAEHADQLANALLMSQNSSKPSLINVRTARIPHPDFLSHV